MRPNYFHNARKKYYNATLLKLEVRRIRRCVETSKYIKTNWLRKTIASR